MTNEIKITPEEINGYIAGVDTKKIANIDYFIESAKNDVVRELRSDWWPRAVAEYYPDVRNAAYFYNRRFEMERSLLNFEQLRNAIIYKCLYQYVLRSISDLKDDDAKKQRDQFKTDFEIEIERVKDVFLYDFDRDGQFEPDFERTDDYNPKGLLER